MIVAQRPSPYKYAGSLGISNSDHGRTVGYPAGPGRVRGWRLDLGVADPLLSVSCESASVPPPCLVSIPCHLEPDMRFSLIRLSDNLILAVFKDLRIFHSGRSTPTRFEQPSFQRHSRSSVLSNPSLNLPIVATGAIHNHPVVETSQCCSHSGSSSATHV